MVRTQCRPCYNAYMAAYMLARYHRRRAAAIVQLGGACIRCANTVDLEFDHVDRHAKTAEIADLFSQGEARLQAELKKCQLLCRACHIDKTAFEIGVEHGGGLSGKDGCRCLDCKARKREYMKRYNGRKRRSRALLSS
jgi:hypothetical protein